MKDKKLPTSVGQSIFEPIHFPNLEDICERLDKLYVSSEISPDVKPSEIFRGALYAMHHQHENQNPDWMSQSANSLREIFYDLEHISGLDRRSVLEQYGSTYDEVVRVQEISKYHKFFQDIAHHNLSDASINPIIGGSKEKPIELTRKIFEKAVYEYSQILFSVLRRQIDAHNEVDKLIEGKISDQEKIEKLDTLLNLNEDAKKYFFLNVDKTWIDFLWENGFLDAIKNSSADSSRYSFSLIEIGYMERIAEEVPDIITAIILDDETATTKENFNPEVIDRFIKITSKLPAQNVSEIIKKIEKQQWVVLMGNYSQWGFEYSKILENLFNTDQHEDILELSKALLEIRDKEEYKKRKRSSYLENPFFINNFGFIKLFRYLNKISDDLLVPTLNELLTSLTHIVKLGEVADEKSVFEINDEFKLLDQDIFSLSPSESEHLSERENVRELIATILHLTKRAFEFYENDSERILAIYNNSFRDLPDCQIAWRIKLFILALQPSIFSEQLQNMFDRIFPEMKNQKAYYELLYRTEFKKALRKSFEYLGNDFQRTYIKKVFDSFSTSFIDEDDEKRKKLYGLQIISSVYHSLLESEIKDCEQYFGQKCDPNYSPVPLIGKAVGGFVNPKAPITEEDFGKLTIQEISEKLTDAWEPEKLKELNTKENFLSPINAEGVGKLLESDIHHRFDEYIENANLFFNRENLNEHYTYSFLVGIREYLRLTERLSNEIDLGNLIDLLIDIKESGESNSFDENHKSFDHDIGLTSSWQGVHLVIAEIMEELISHDPDIYSLPFQSYREKYLELIKYLLKSTDPKISDESLQTATFSEQSPPDRKKKVSSPYTYAINSVRGRSFIALIKFIYRDQENDNQKKGSDISSDVIGIIEDLLVKEDTKAIMFLMGRYIPTFYYRNPEWLISQLPKIFSEEKNKKSLSLAAWEGFLSTDLYKEIFFDPNFQALYEKGLNASVENDPERKFFIEPEKGIARHLALAVIFFPEDFGFDSKLFKKFWDSSDSNKIEFVNFIGRAIISTENEKTINNLKENEESRDRISELWKWILAKEVDVELFSEFGFWIDLSKDIFQIEGLVNLVQNTLEKSKGILNWDLGLTKTISEFASNFPEKTFEIVKLFLLEGILKSRGFFFLDDEWINAIKILYSHPKTRDKTESLINILISKGSQKFWKLKQIVEKHN